MQGRPQTLWRLLIGHFTAGASCWHRAALFDACGSFANAVAGGADKQEALYAVAGFLMDEAVEGLQ